jgi:hypothetical protein
MLKLIFTVLFVAGVSVFAAIQIAEARQCNTTCTTVGGYTSCNTYCW